jgi:hypothetical protein
MILDTAELISTDSVLKAPLCFAERAEGPIWNQLVMLKPTSWNYPKSCLNFILRDSLQGKVQMLNLILDGSHFEKLKHWA